MKRISILFALFILVYALSGQTLPNSQYYSSVGGEVSDSLFIPVDTTSRSGSRTQAIFGERIIYWVHGLGGSASSWQRAAAITEYGGSIGYPARKVLCSRPTYSQNSNLMAAALDLDLQLSSLNSTPDWDTVPRNQHFIIAHSQGGLVSRMLDTLYSDSINFRREFGGIVTFGTPHWGAKILDNSDPRGKNMLSPFVKELCGALVQKELTDAALRIKNTFISNLIVGSDLIPGISNGVCDAIEGTMFTLLFSNYSLPITQDYWDSTEVVKKINSHHTNTPVVVAYGVEEQPVFWRTLSSLVLEDTTVSIPAFGFDDDSYLVDSANRTINRLWSKREHFRILIRRMDRRIKIFARISPLTFVAYDYWDYRRRRGSARNSENAYNRLYMWFVNANPQWERIIGSRESKFVREGYRCYCTDERNPSNYIVNKLVNSTQECSNNGNPFLMCYTQENWILNSTLEENDGIVLKHSAGSLPSAIGFMKMNKTNHIQMRFSSETRNVLIDLFDPNEIKYIYFNTSQR